MSVGSSKNQDACDNQVLLLNSFVMARHHDCSSVSIKVFLEFQLAVCDCMLQLIRTFVEQFIDYQA